METGAKERRRVPARALPPDVAQRGARASWTDEGRARRGLSLIMSNLPAAAKVVAGWSDLTPEQRDGLRNHLLPAFTRVAERRADG